MCSVFEKQKPCPILLLCSSIFSHPTGVSAFIDGITMADIEGNMQKREEGMSDHVDQYFIHVTDRQISIGTLVEEFSTASTW